MAGPNDNGRTPPGKAPGSGRGEGERRNGDDTPRETPSAKVSEGRIPKAPVQKPPAEGRNGSTPVPDGGTASGGHADAVRLDLPVVPRDAPPRREVSPEAGGAATPSAGTDALVRKDEDPWRAPDVDAPGGARLDVGVGRVYVRTFQARGVLGAVLVLLGFLIVFGLVVAMFTVAVGIGAAIAVGGTLAALFGVGAARVRRALKQRDRAELDRKDDRG